MRLLATADPDVSWLYSRLSGILRSSQLRELSGLAGIYLVQVLRNAGGWDSWRLVTRWGALRFLL